MANKTTRLEYRRHIAIEVDWLRDDPMSAREDEYRKGAQKPRWMGLKLTAKSLKHGAAVVVRAGAVASIRRPWNSDAMLAIIRGTKRFQQIGPTVLLIRLPAGYSK